MKEKPISLGDEGVRWGVLTHAAIRPGPSGARPGVVLLNAGMVHRVGPSRLSVKIARRLALSGYTVLRFDLSGIGDSEPRSDSLPFAQSVLRESSEAMDYLRDAAGLDSFVLMGLCTGADISFKAACADERVEGIVLLNPQGFALDTSESVRSQVIQRQNLRYYLRAALFNPASWRKLLGGRADLGDIARSIAALGASKLRRAAPESQGRNEMAQEFHALGRREVRTLLVFSDGDPGLDYVRAMLGQELDALCARESFRLEIVRGADHVFTSLRTQELLLELIQGWLSERTGQLVHAKVS